MSDLALGLMCAIIVVVLSGVLFMINRTSFKPHQADKHHEEVRRGAVQGGTHVGGGRSVAPRRDEEVFPDDDPNQPTVPVQQPRDTPVDW